MFGDEGREGEREGGGGGWKGGRWEEEVLGRGGREEWGGGRSGEGGGVGKREEWGRGRWSREDRGEGRWSRAEGPAKNSCRHAILVIIGRGGNGSEKKQEEASKAGGIQSPLVARSRPLWSVGKLKKG